MRRDYPEPLIALLVFLLGLWLWNHHFGANPGYAPGTERAALIKIDRDLRLADAMAQDPAWLRWFAAVDQPAHAKAEALRALEELIRARSATAETMELHAILKNRTANPLYQNTSREDFRNYAFQLANHQGNWWQAKIVETMEATHTPAIAWKFSYGMDNSRLRTRAIVCRSFIWLVGIFGLTCLPATITSLAHLRNRKPTGYFSRWTVPLGLVVFLAALLAWIGLVSALEIGIAALPPFHPLFGILIDICARLLPACIAIAFLFRRASHATRILGLARPPAIRAMLGIVPVLLIVDLFLQAAFGGNPSADPSGGIDTADAGLWGLAFSLVSACLVAPFAEEILHRGILFPSLRNQLGLIPAAAASALMFGLLHFYDGYGMISVGLFGFVCALLFAATGSLWTSILLHMLYNSFIKIPEWIVYHAPLG